MTWRRVRDCLQQRNNKCFSAIFRPSSAGLFCDPGRDTVFQSDLSQVKDGNAFCGVNNPGGFFPCQFFEEFLPVFHRIECRGGSDGVPEGKLFQKKQVPKRHICAVGPDNLNGKTERYHSLNGFLKKILRICAARKQFRINEKLSDKGCRKLKTWFPPVFFYCIRLRPPPFARRTTEGLSHQCPQPFSRRNAADADIGF